MVGSSCNNLQLTFVFVSTGFLSTQYETGIKFANESFDLALAAGVRINRTPEECFSKTVGMALYSFYIIFMPLKETM